MAELSRVAGSSLFLRVALRVLAGGGGESCSIHAYLSCAARKWPNSALFFTFGQPRGWSPQSVPKCGALRPSPEHDEQQHKLSYHVQLQAQE